MTNLSIEQLVKLRKVEEEKINVAKRRLDEINGALYDMSERLDLALR